MLRFACLTAAGLCALLCLLDLLRPAAPQAASQAAAPHQQQVTGCLFSACLPASVVPSSSCRALWTLMCT
jgi:hypothetical protein